MKFSLLTAIALTLLAVLGAAIYSENLRMKDTVAKIEDSKAWLASFNHHSIETLPYYQKALQYEDPLLTLRDELVANAQQVQKTIESMPQRSESDVSIIEVATMSPFCYTYAIHVPENQKASLVFYSAKSWDDPLEKHLTDTEAPFSKTLTVELQTGLSKLEVLQTSIREKDPPAKPGPQFVKLTPQLQLKLNGKSLFQEQIPNYMTLGSNHGWKPDSKEQITLDYQKDHVEFWTYRYIEAPTNTWGSGMPAHSSKGFSVKFRLAIDKSLSDKSGDEN